jgi:hypothetical protein
VVFSGEIASHTAFWLEGHTLCYLFVLLGHSEVILAKVFTAELLLEQWQKLPISIVWIFVM